MKKALLLTILCAAALTACSDNNAAIEISTEPTTGATTTVTTEVQTATATATTETTTETTTVDEISDSEPPVIETNRRLASIMEEFDIDKIAYYDPTQTDLDPEIRIANMRTVPDDIAEEAKQKLREYLEANEFEMLDHRYLPNYWELLGRDEKCRIFVKIEPKQRFKADGMPYTNLDTCDLIFSDDMKYIAIYESQGFTPYRIPDPEELQFLYDLVPE